MFSVQSFHALCVGRKFARQQSSNAESSIHQLALLVAFLDCLLDEEISWEHVIGQPNTIVSGTVDRLWSSPSLYYWFPFSLMTESLSPTGYSMSHREVRLLLLTLVHHRLKHKQREPPPHTLSMVQNSP